MSSLRSFVPRSIKRSLGATRKQLRALIDMLDARRRRPNLYDLSSAERVGVIFTAQSDMRTDERLFLYAFVRGVMPQRVLEIGVLNGGVGCIMANAMEENWFGQIVGLDPSPALRVSKRSLHNRYDVITKPSPEGIVEARDRLGGPFDFVLIDGLHMYDQVVRDITGVLPHVADGGYLLFHDSFHYGVATAITEAVQQTPELIDCGYVCRTASINADRKTPYNGFRLLRKASRPIVDVYDAVTPLYARSGKSTPPFHRDVLNHDIRYCRAVAPCEQCRKDATA